MGVMVMRLSAVSTRSDRVARCLFSSNSSSNDWMTMYNKLVNFRSENGHAYVPSNHPLADWSKSVRKTKQSLGKSQKVLLENVGFEWKARDALWMGRYHELLAYSRDYDGDTQVPRSYNEKLHWWVVTQRRKMRAGHMDKQKEDLLNEIGFVWEPHNDQWEEKFEQLRKWNAEGLGDENSMAREDPQLLVWCLTQRKAYRVRQGTAPEESLVKPLSLDRLKKLKSIGFVFDRWGERFSQLQHFYEKHGHPFVATKDDKHLEHWIWHQREFFNALDWNSLPASRAKKLKERKEKLESVGFSFDLVEDRWRSKYDDLVSFKERHGHCHVPSSEKYLRRWVDKQRVEYELKQKGGSSSLTQDHIRALDSLDFNWSTDGWQDRFTELAKFQDAYGHCNPPPSHMRGLSMWVNRQRRERSSLSKEKIQALDSIGFVWDPHRGDADDQMLPEGLRVLQKYRTENDSYNRINHLASWLKDQWDGESNGK